MMRELERWKMNLGNSNGGERYKRREGGRGKRERREGEKREEGVSKGSRFVWRILGGLSLIFVFLSYIVKS